MGRKGATEDLGNSSEGVIPGYPDIFWIRGRALELAVLFYTIPVAATVERCTKPVLDSQMSRFDSPLQNS